MKIYHTLIVCLSWFGFLQGQQELFLQGNYFFEKAKYTQACKAYQSITNPGYSVLYNLAISYLYQNNHAQALVFIKRAEKQATFAQLTNLYQLIEYIEKLKNPEFALTLFDQLAIFCKKCILSVSMLLLQSMLFMILCLLILLWYRRWYIENMVKFICLIIILILLSLVFIYKVSMLQERIGIVTQDKISLYAGPDRSFYQKSILQNSDQMTIINQQQNYYHVKMQHAVGWVCADDIQIV